MSNNFYPAYNQGDLDAQSEKILTQIAESNGTPLVLQTPQQARECFLEKSWLGAAKGDVQIKNVIAGNSASPVPLRIYTSGKEGALPIVLFFHGGGFVLGTLDEFEEFCKYIAIGSSCIVVSVDYRLAPEHKYPAAVEDANTAVNWVQENSSSINGDSTRIAVMGDSAGANLSIAATFYAREKGTPKIIKQVLICPWVDMALTETESYTYFGKGLWLSTENMHWYRDHYLQNIEQSKSTMASPIFIDYLSDLPPALIITAEFDVLRSEGEEYASKLERAGVEVKCSRYNGMLHDFVTLPGLFDKALDAINEICSELNKVFNV